MGKVWFAVCAAIAIVLAPPAHAQAPTRLVLATPETAAAAFVADDAFMAALTPADLSIRLKRTDSPTAADLAVHYSANIAAWDEAERARLEAAFARVGERLMGLEAWLPDEIVVVKTTSEFESGLPHTRGAAISMGARLPPQDAQLDEVLFHEVFHVLSRAASEEGRDALYGVIGFERCARLELPADTEARMFTNPDAPIVAHAAPLSAPHLLATPILVADPPHYDPAKTRIFEYFEVEIVALRRDEQGVCAPAADVALTRDEMLAGIFARAGGNTDYVFHPEELMADNFAQMMMGRADAPNPEIYDRLAAVLGIARP